MRTWIALSLTIALLACWGCGAETPKPADSAAEVPQPAGAHEHADPGPPPGGQSEPEVEPTGGTGTPAEEGTIPPLPAGTDPSGVNPSATGSAAEGESACDPATTPEAAPAEETATVTLQVGAWADVEKVIADNKGKVVVVDLWSTSCHPCRREFPNLVKIHEELGEQVICISVSTDYSGIPSKPVESYRPKVEAFLQQQSATFDNFLLNQDAESVFTALELGSIPAVFVYDAEGQLVQRFADPVDGEEFTYAEDIRPVVEKLLPAAE